MASKTVYNQRMTLQAVAARLRRGTIGHSSRMRIYPRIDRREYGLLLALAELGRCKPTSLAEELLEAGVTALISGLPDEERQQLEARADSLLADVKEGNDNE